MDTVEDLSRRLSRAMRLTVVSRGCDRYRVTGGSAPHTVWVLSDGRGHCDCPDFAHGGGTRACKHLLAVALTMCGDDVRTQVAELVSVGNLR